MSEVTPIFPDMFEFWENRKIECENGAEIADRNLGRLALIDQLQFDYGESMQAVSPPPLTEV